eukprot:CAMPEP_0172579914 /NCGR_PEP_ID=MMETSP1067-20121228/139490_1 /TAXON_ID=265564 ORGANISM="Thalassiosira punctigera, Strain Tpunct2005C2" /NCGR_SAMPLE_ID=MMETSP1067 /ASSEMBLY_ACC=CAM_ASM_000444 /LENGTH=63 /DNA_ID=CAMNT_0013372645 /DNA_START=1531 /DNA_END=1722 /DNA_ORIENTATION=-
MANLTNGLVSPCSATRMAEANEQLSLSILSPVTASPSTAQSNAVKPKMAKPQLICEAQNGGSK